MILKCLLPILFLFLIQSQAVAQQPSSELPAQVDVTREYKKSLTQWNDFKRHHGSYVVRLIEDRKGRARMALSGRKAKLIGQYHELKQSLWFWEQAFGLQKALVNQYMKINPHQEPNILRKVQNEANDLARVLIESTVRLQEEYGINNFPVVHNLYILIGLKKRGACKDWAEDLLKIINAMKHDYFMSYWGEAHAGNMLEHNVAVLVPLNAKFEDGVLYDPWRTAGKPYWSVVKEDSYPWRQWEGYEPK